MRWTKKNPSLPRKILIVGVGALDDPTAKRQFRVFQRDVEGAVPYITTIPGKKPAALSGGRFGGQLLTQSALEELDDLHHRDDQ